MLLYSIVHGVWWTTQRAYHVTLWQTCSFQPNSPSLGSIQSLQLLHEDYALTFPPPSIARNSIYNWVNWGIVERTKMPELRNGSKGDSNPGYLDSDSGILPLSYVYLCLPRCTGDVWLWVLTSSFCISSACFILILSTCSLLLASNLWSWSLCCSFSSVTKHTNTFNALYFKG